MNFIGVLAMIAGLGFAVSAVGFVQMGVSYCPLGCASDALSSHNRSPGTLSCSELSILSP